MKNYQHLEAWRRQYGDFVRTGPSEIAIFHPDAVPLILGPRSKCSKSPWYDVTLPMVSMHSTRDKAAHDRRRRIWDRGFNTKGMQIVPAHLATVGPLLT
jgi:tryprostatin B 6-hydroxylase